MHAGDVIYLILGLGGGLFLLGKSKEAMYPGKYIKRPRRRRSDASRSEKKARR